MLAGGICFGVGKRRLYVSGLIVILFATILPARAGDGSPVLATRRSEWLPAAATGYLAWSQNSRARPNNCNVYAKPGGETKFKVNAPTTQASTGNIDGTTLVYAQWSGNRGDIKLFDLVARTRSNPPAGVNTRRHESSVSKSGDWILFSRSRTLTRPGTQRILLLNLVTDEPRLLATGDGGTRWAQPGEVSGNYATWVKCRRLTYCNIYLYDIAAGTSRKVPNSRRLAMFAASVTSDGTVFFAQSNNISCGRNVGIYSYPIGGPKTREASLGRGRDTAKTSPRMNDDGSVSIFYDRINCRTGAWDIYKVAIPAP